MLKNRVFVIVCVFVLAVVLVACGPIVVYKGAVEVPQNGWHKDTVAVFRSEVANLEETCHLLLEVENTDTYSYNNIWFFVDAVSPGGYVQRDTLDCRLANDTGDWFGKSNWGSDAFKSVHPYKLNIRFPEKGTYKYYVVQGMRDTLLTGITSVGIKIIEAN
ncbi:gliding motility lipoprotein GldH [Saccharicrinis sp. 156]|uniref:gliding motility lipoprotein GldH n=1 Tax=Saccharicrinis sp. 156 TaxID=3417574 RepID=UPI003D3520DA